MTRKLTWTRTSYDCQTRENSCQRSWQLHKRIECLNSCRLFVCALYKDSCIFISLIPCTDKVFFFCLIAQNRQKRMKTSKMWKQGRSLNSSFVSFAFQVQSVPQLLYWQKSICNRVFFSYLDRPWSGISVLHLCCRHWIETLCRVRDQSLRMAWQPDWHLSIGSRAWVELRLSSSRREHEAQTFRQLWIDNARPNAVLAEF